MSGHEMSSSSCSSARPHLNLQPTCGACADIIFDLEPTVVLLGSEDPRPWPLTRHIPFARPFPFPPHGDAEAIPTEGEFTLCRWSAGTCADCAANPQECAAFHADCFALFRARAPGRSGHADDASAALHELWLVATRRLPWPKCPRLHFLPPGPPVGGGGGRHSGSSAAALAVAAAAYGLPWLADMPAEIVALVYAQSRHEPLWRILAVLVLLERFGLRSCSPAVDVPLSEISGWVRGQAPTLLRDPAVVDPDSYVRVALDVWGICSIERLEQRPRFATDGAGWGPRDRLYVIERARTLADTRVTIRSGLLRLEGGGPAQHHHLRLWDTPGRISRASQRARFTQDPSAWARVRTIQLDGLAGITFFFGSNTLLDVFPHRSADSNAQPAWERLTARQRLGALWRYLPLGGDRVIAVGVRFNKTTGGYNVLIRTETGGDHTLGTIWDANPPQSPLSHGTGTTLLLDHPPEGSSVQGFGVVCTRPTPFADRPRSIAFVHPDPAMTAPAMQYSAAPLDGVVAAEVFYGEGARCRGILLYYADEKIRALGECRVNAAPSARVDQPTAMCFRRLGHRQHDDGAEDGFDDEYGDGEAEEDEEGGGVDVEDGDYVLVGGGAGAGRRKGGGAASYADADADGDADTVGAIEVEFSRGYCSARHGRHRGGRGGRADNRRGWRWVALRGLVEFWFSWSEIHMVVSSGED